MRYWKCVNVDKEDINTFTLNKIYISDDYGLNFKDDEDYVHTTIPIYKTNQYYNDSDFKETSEEKFITSITFSTIESILDREYPNGWQIV